MPKDTTSPFSPGHPVPVEFFVGRLGEIERLRRRVESSLRGQVECAFVVGERGIGKSSLAGFVKQLCERDFLTVHAFLGGVDSLEGFIQRLFDHLLKDNADRPAMKAIRELLGNRITEVGLFGISLKFDPGKEDVDLLARNFVPSLRKLVEKIQPDKKGLLIILDDLNGLANVPMFANWFKSVVDEVGVSGRPLPVAFVFAGLEERRRAMIAHQPSVGRVFDVIDIGSWSDDEARDFYTASFEKAAVVVESDAMDMLVRYTGGLPVLAHEIGDAAFAVDDDGRIDRDDAMNAIASAAEVVGRKHLDPHVFSSLRSERYRKILRRLADEPFAERFTRAAMIEKLPQDEVRVLDNFLKKMRDLGVLVDDVEQGRGAYRFSNRLHYLYFFFEAARAKDSHVR